MTRSSERMLWLALVAMLIAVALWQGPLAPVVEKDAGIQQWTLPFQPTVVRDSLPAPAPPTTAAPADTNGLEDELAQARAKIIALERQLADLSAPLEADVRSAAVNAEIGNDETLVTGGYQTPDGLTHFLFLTPVRHELPDGRVAVKLQGSQFALRADQLENSELADMTTNAGNTLQHGQAWKNDEMARVITEMKESDSGDRFSAPSVITMPGMRAEVSVGEEFSYSITPDFLEGDAGFQLQMRMEHAPAVTAELEP